MPPREEFVERCIALSEADSDDDAGFDLLFRRALAAARTVVKEEILESSAAEHLRARAVEMGKKGAAARMTKLSPGRRAQIASAAASARWQKVAPKA